MAVSARTTERRRVRARVAGVVQGVGFRPYVFRLAEELELGGWVLNDERGVEVEVEGEPASVEEFLARLPADAPPLATVESVRVEPARASGELSFRIVESERGAEPEALVSADFATCPDCLTELFDPADRRHRYPFINCTNCGPRFTIVRGVPYDRPLTTMAGFAMCEGCRAEYEDPRDRRFHAQPNACPECGPRLRLLDPAGAELARGRYRDAVAAAAAMLAAGKVVAVKGLGGYHLACRADDEAAVRALRLRKHREDKPFALMCANLAAARDLVELTAHEEELLAGPERPIVIARRRPWAEVASAVAPYSPDLGVMLAYSPLHHLLLADSGRTLVMTSGNVSDEPIAYRDDDARERLGAIADALLVGDRPIHIRTDDSVLRSLDPGVRFKPLLMRRSRGFVPTSIELPLEAPPLLACGAELKSTFCVAKGRRAWVSHHIGDLKNWETLHSFREGVEHFERVFAVEPRLIAHDLHPDYLSTREALEREGLEPVGRPAPSRPSRRLPRGARRARAGDRRDLRRERLRHRRNRVGRRAARRRPRGVRSRGAAVPGPPAGWRRCGWRAVEDGVRVARAVTRRGAARDPVTAPHGGRTPPLGCGLRARSHRRRLAAHHQRRAALRRGGGAVRSPRDASTTRARPRSSSKARATGRSGARTRCRYSPPTVPVRAWARGR